MSTTELNSLSVAKNLFGQHYSRIDLDGLNVTKLYDDTESVQLESTIINDVKIFPSRLVLEHAYEGKRYQKKITIQNIGKYQAFIRILPPTSHIFEIKPCVEGLTISPGLKIVKTVKYKYMSAVSVPKVLMPILINKTWFNYEFVVTLATAIISIKPKIVDFECIDANQLVISRTLSISNSGYKGTQYSIDLGNNHLQLVVEPMKGSIHAKSTTQLRIEIVGSEVGTFMEEFWIKTSPPQRVIVKGTFIEPKLITRSFYSSLNLTIVRFPKIYYGARATRPLIVKNFSSSNSMFCVLAESQGRNLPIEEAKKTDFMYHYLRLQPTEGRVYSEKGSVLRITLEPTKLEGVQHQFIRQCTCVFRIVRMGYRDIKRESSIATEEAASKFDLHAKSENSSSKRSLSETSQSITSVGTGSESESILSENFNYESYAMRVIVHGDIDIAEINIRPDIIILQNLIVGRCYERELHIKNPCADNYLIIKYRKYVTVNITPSELKLKGGESIQVLMQIKCTKLIDVNTEIFFDLFYPDQPVGEANSELRLVGEASLHLQYNSIFGPIKKPDDSCLMTVMKREDFTAGHRIWTQNSEVFQLSCKEIQKKLKNDQYYFNYIKQLQKTSKNKINQRESIKIIPKIKCASTTLSAIQLPPRPGEEAFIPLSPSQLYLIKIKPTFVRFKKSAPFTRLQESLIIENLNPFPVHITLKPLKSHIEFISSIVVINAGEKHVNYFYFQSHNLGKYYCTIEIIINSSHLFQVATFGEVVLRNITLNSYTVYFHNEQPNRQYIELHNDLSAECRFHFELPQSPYTIYPDTGTVPPYTFLLCMVSYEPLPAFGNSVDAVLETESLLKTTVQCLYKLAPPVIRVSPKQLDCGIIPWNTTIRKAVTFLNTQNNLVYYQVVNSQPIEGINIYPSQGLLKAKEYLALTVTLHFKAIISFRTEVHLIFHDNKKATITITGTVDSPNFVVQPDNLKFEKLSPFSYDTLAFSFTNNSACCYTINLAMDNYPELLITSVNSAQAAGIKELYFFPHETKLLYCHFIPTYICTYTIFLPIIINGLLGPPLINNNTSMRYVTFLQGYEDKYLKTSEATIIRPSTYLPLLRINMCAIHRMLDFSTMHVCLVYYGEKHSANKLSEVIKIVNVCDEDISMCIRIDELQPPISLHPILVPDLDVYPLSYSWSLQPGAEATFQASFDLISAKECNIQQSLPIFVRDYLDGRVFNLLTLEAVCALPKLVPNPNKIYFETVPLEQRTQQTIIINVEKHVNGCSLHARSSGKVVVLKFPEGNNLNEDDTEIKAVVNVMSITKIAFDESVLITCTCGSQCDIKVKGLIVSSTLLCHSAVNDVRCKMKEDEAELMNLQSEERSQSSCTVVKFSYKDSYVQENPTDFPLFPSKDDNSQRANHLRTTLDMLEHWIYTQALSRKIYYRIPESFSQFHLLPVIDSQHSYVKKSKLLIPEPIPLFELMIHLLGPSIRKLLKGKIKSSEEHHQMIYLYNNYVNIIEYLCKRNVIIPHLRPKYLLKYEHYRLFTSYKEKDSKYDLQFQNKVLDEETFGRISTQCWFDLIFHIIVELVIEKKLTSIQAVQSKTKSRQRLSILSNSHKVSDNNNITNTLGIYCSNTIKLINWFMLIYLEQHSKLWMLNFESHKEIHLLDVDLRDCIIFGAVTAYFCPFKCDEIKNMYVTPITEEQIFHNCCVMVQVWESLLLSYEITPQRLFKPKEVDLILLMCYLYEILPTLKPKETLQIWSALSEHGSYKLDVKNTSKKTICYKAVFFQNTRGLFKLEQNFIKIRPGQTTAITIDYYAKFIDKTSGILLLSGETAEFFYATNLVFCLEGVPDLLSINNEVTLEGVLYKTVETKLMVHSPYKVPGTYNCFFATDSNAPMEPLNNFTIASGFSLDSPLLLDQETKEFNAKGVATLKTRYCCIQPGKNLCLLYYLNPIIGDWAVMIKVDGKITNKNREIISVKLPENFEKHKCNCHPSPDLYRHCLKMIDIPIPSRNIFLWILRKQMILDSVYESEKPFWALQLENQCGDNIMEAFMKSTSQKLQNPARIYKIEYDRSTTEFIAPESIFITDVLSDDIIQLPVHAIADLNNKDIQIRLREMDNKEIRLYTIHFYTETKKCHCE